MSLLSVSATLLAGCKSGPQITPWIGEVDGLVYAQSRIVWMDAKGFRCLSPDDTRRFWRSCRIGNSPGNLNFCIVTGGGVADCVDGETRTGLELVNWVCLDEGDSEEFLIFCKRRSKEAQ